jgi:DNA-binding MurR/RpiR family transcriptional regulator
VAYGTGSPLCPTEPNLSASRQGLIREILDHVEETYFLPSRALAKRFDLDPTTIVRTVQALGYKRDGDLAADLRSHFVTRITPLRAYEIRCARQAQCRQAY